MDKHHNLQTGRIGEDKSCEYLEHNGFDIIVRNHRTKYGETDIVAKKGNKLVFVEVRTKTGDQFGLPEDTLTKIKMMKLRKNALAYVSRNHWLGHYHIDAICIILDHAGNVQYLRHYENIIS